MIITLAGHVDHGKTSLVRALTGVETDRLEEEKRRGLTIDLGFAYINEDGTTLGFVDVPGHHRFIHNMVAGVAAMQHALLVIAADDGPMPQSREHLQILELLGVDQGTVALTKCDRVSDERRVQARAEIEQLLAGTFLDGCDVIETSVETGEGVQAVRDALLAAAAEHSPEKANENFRLPVDRAFTITGAGVVVTGTVHDGSVCVDDSLRVFPTGRQVRVKSLRAQDSEVKTANAGDRCAVNLSGLSIDQIRRGCWLTASQSVGSLEFSVNLQILADFPRKIRHWMPVHIYHSTSHTTGSIALLEEGQLDPGGRGLVEIVCDEPLLVARGDRLIIRDQGLERTLGGGTVVTVEPVSGRRRDSIRLSRISADNTDDVHTAFTRHLELGAVDLDRFASNWSLGKIELQGLLDGQDALDVEGHAVAETQLAAWRKEVVSFIEQQHTADPSLQGAKLSEIHTNVPNRFLKSLLAELVSDRSLIVHAGRFLPAGHSVSLSPEEQKTLETVTRHLDQPQPPSLGDLSKQLRIPIPELAKRFHPLVSKKQIIKVSDTRYYLPAHMDKLAQVARDLNEAGPFTVREYRDAASIGRNVAIEVLEYFDHKGFTRRNADTRSITGDLARLKG